MRSRIKYNSKSQKLRNGSSTTIHFIDKKLFITMIYSLYILILIFSRMSNVAEDVADTYLQDSFSYQLQVQVDGWTEFCNIDRYNLSLYGEIYVTYTKSSNTMEVDCYNIKNLEIESIEAFDLTDGQANTLTLDVEDVFDLSETVNAEVDAALPEKVEDSAIIRGETGDTVNLVVSSDAASPASGSGDAGAWVQTDTNVQVPGDSGDTFDVYVFQVGSDPLAHVAVDTDVTTVT